jgi:hypothetical protein
MNSALLVIKALHLMMLAYSIAHTFLYKWSVQLVKIHSSPRLASKQGMEWYQIHLLPLLVMAQLLHAIQMQIMPTFTTVYSGLETLRSIYTE